MECVPGSKGAGWGRKEERFEGSLALWLLSGSVAGVGCEGVLSTPSALLHP